MGNSWSTVSKNLSPITYEQLRLGGSILFPLPEAFQYNYADFCLCLLTQLQSLSSPLKKLSLTSHLMR